MSIILRENPYAGVNAHLHSIFQAEGGWTSFHTSFITAFARDLDSNLPAGFLVDVEQSLQIREVHPDTGERLRRPEPDLTVYRVPVPGGRERVPAGAFAGAGQFSNATLMQSLAESLDMDTDAYLSALIVYAALPDARFGRPVTRIELLSPANKVGVGYEQYREKRVAGLKSGVALVEIDLLHHTPPVVRGVPIYPEQEGSHPYLITIADPTPTFDDGFSATYGFDVDAPFPAFPLPLSDGRSLTVDLNPVYQDVFSSLSAYRLRADYAQLPAQFHRYSTADRARIEAVMERARVATGET